MSTKGTIAGVLIEADDIADNATVHIYTECFDDLPRPVYIELWEQGDHASHDMTICMPQAKALELADEMAKWAADIREWQAREAAKEKL